MRTAQNRRRFNASIRFAGVHLKGITENPSGFFVSSWQNPGLTALNQEISMPKWPF